MSVSDKDREMAGRIASQTDGLVKYNDEISRSIENDIAEALAKARQEGREEAPKVEASDLQKLIFSLYHEPMPSQEWTEEKLIELRIQALKEGAEKERERVIKQLEPLQILRKMWTIKEIIEAIRKDNISDKS